MSTENEEIVELVSDADASNRGLEPLSYEAMMEVNGSGEPWCVAFIRYARGLMDTPGEPELYAIGVDMAVSTGRYACTLYRGCVAMIRLHGAHGEDVARMRALGNAIIQITTIFEFARHPELEALFADLDATSRIVL